MAVARSPEEAAFLAFVMLPSNATDEIFAGLVEVMFSLISVIVPQALCTLTARSSFLAAPHPREAGTVRVGSELEPYDEKRLLCTYVPNTYFKGEQSEEIVHKEAEGKKLFVRFRFYWKISMI